MGKKSKTAHLHLTFALFTFPCISCYAIKIPGEIVWYGHYRSSSKNITYDVHLRLLRKGGHNRRLLLASQNCYFLCRRDNFRDRNNAVRINTSFLHVLKVLDFERKLLFNALITSDFFSGTLTCAWRILIFSSKIMCNLFWFSRRSWRARQMWNPPPLTTCCCWGQQQVSQYEFSVICSSFLV